MTSSDDPGSAVVDTNQVVSGFLLPRGNPFQLLEAWRVGAFVLVVSDLIVEEYARVLPRPKFARRYGVTPTAIAAFLSLISARARHVTPVPHVPVTVRDGKDVMVLATALGGSADYLVTGDEDLLELRGYPELGTLRIVTVREFLDGLRDRRRLPT